MGQIVGFILEDDSNIGSLLKKFLEIFLDNVEIFIFSNVSDFLDAFDSTTPDFVICDGSLPDGTGPAAVEKFRSRHFFTPVVIIYHGGTTEIPQNFRCDGIFTKPTRLSKISDRIRQALQSRQALTT